MDYDIAIVGLGIYGSALARELSGRGMSVIAFDRFNPPHAEGSSHGETRIYRRVPFNGSPYVEMMGLSINELHKFERESGRSFVVETGGLDMGPEDGDRVQNTLKLCRAYNLPYEVLDCVALKKRFPLFNLPEGAAAVYQPSSGYLRVEDLWSSLLEHAVRHGAVIRKNTSVIAVEESDSGVAVRLESETITARQAIVSAGAYLSSLLPEMKKAVQPLRQLVAWFDPPAAEQSAARDLPIFTYKNEKRWYGFPDVDGSGIKLGWHNIGAEAVSADPGREPAVSPEEIRIMRDDMARFMPSLAGIEPRVAKCLYTQTDDENFIVDRAPGRDNIHIVSCCSGHGFKYALGLATLIADRVEGKSDSPHLQYFKIK